MYVYGVGERLLEGIKSFYENASAFVLVDRECSESFNVEVGLRQGCVMSPWLFNIYMDGCIREMKDGLGDLGKRRSEMRDVTMAVQYLYEWMYKRNERRSGGFR